ncbi:flagellar basal body-associated FliL family protein [Vagococcus sp. BWB3-3]|uniref:Flagellar protein FliL n=1 Tax=Vagococcus allomyrinae TaxID=2794353 RepID=A0A940PBQ3_9ENTE|nr:flagellar basal body-associated FliL family protein [Vagococcus allomyrinae]MBP1042039.1 flagellar basal body-associated FliL family protein [Vagococcus allomyrinae]
MAEKIDEQHDKPKKRNKTMLLVIAVLIIAIGGGAVGTFIGNYFSNQVHGKEVPEEVDQKFSEHEVSVPLDEFLVNLAKSKNNEMPYIKVQLSLMVSSEKNAEVIATSKDLIRDSIINTLRQKEAESILHEKNGVDNLKQEIKEQVNKDYGSALVREVFITNLVIQ